MIFSELYGTYYNAVAKILGEAVKRPITRQKMREIVEEWAFSESILSVEPALLTGRWPLLRPDGMSVLEHAPDMPLTLLEKRWLKAISLDPRIQLFGCEIAGLEEITPLFLPEDIYIFDQYADGDPYTDTAYIEHFRTILGALKKQQVLDIDVKNRQGGSTHMTVIPEYLEYSEKDDKFRLITSRCHYGRVVNLAKILSVKPCKMDEKMAKWAEKYAARPQGEGDGTSQQTEAVNSKKEKKILHPYRKDEPTASLVFELYDGRNALERALLHFAHFEKEAERVDERHYRVRVNYNKEDETEMVIRVLSFGPFLRVVEPESFVELVKRRLARQYAVGRREETE